MALGSSEAKARGRRNSRKGAAGQREVAKLLKNWWRHIEPDCVFVSTPRSGGWKHAPRFSACGDLMTDAERFPFVVEVKRRQAWSLRNFEEGRPSPIWGWWAQACRDAERQGGQPMLWFRRDGKRVWRVLLRTWFVATHPVGDPDYSLPLLELPEGVDQPSGFLADTILSSSPISFLEPLP